MKIILGADHGGFEMKERVKSWLGDPTSPAATLGASVVDVGNKELDPDDDYVDYAVRAVMERREGDRVILFCRNGVGMEIVANKRRGVRCGLGFGPEAVRKGRTDDDINALAIPADYCTEEEAKEMVKLFMTTEFSRLARYQKRLVKLDKLETEWSQ